MISPYAERKPQVHVHEIQMFRELESKTIGFDIERREILKYIHRDLLFETEQRTEKFNSSNM